MVSRFAIHDGCGWTLRLVPRRGAEAATPVREECEAAGPERRWLPAVLEALDVFPEAQALVRRTILRLCGELRDEDSS